MPGARSLLAALALLGLGCAPRLAPLSLPAGTGPLSGRGRIVLSAGPSGLSAPCAFALDPAAGRARVEIREPMGATRLVLFLEPGAALLWDPAGGGWTRWERAGGGLPFGPGDLWSALLLRPPGGARGGSFGPEVRATWHNGAGRVRGRFRQGDGVGRAILVGPRGARLEIRFEAVEAAAPPEGAFIPPPLPEEGRTTLPALLMEGDP